MRDVVSPAQIILIEAADVTEGNAFTFKLTILVFTQPFTLVPVTVYCVVDTGETKTLEPVILPGFHVYVAAPVPVKVAVEFAHIVGEETPADTTGNALTVKLTVFVFTQLLALIPVTVYTVVVAGDTTVTEPVKAPGFLV